MRRKRLLVFGGVFNIIYGCVALGCVGILLTALFVEELLEQQRRDLIVLGIIGMAVSFLLVLFNTLFAVVLDNEKIVVKRPFFKDYTMLWTEVAEVEFIRLSLFRFIYITNFSAPSGSKLTMNSFGKKDKLIFLFYSRKKLQVIRQFYKGEIKEFSCKG